MSCIIDSTEAFFCNTDNHFSKLIKDSDGQDKLLKFTAEGLFPLAIEIANFAGADADTMKGLHTAHSGIKITRDVTATLNVFRSTIPIMVGQLKLVGGLFRGLWTGQAVELKERREQTVRGPDNPRVNGENADQYVQEFSWLPPLKHNQEAADRGEMLLQLGANFGGFVGAATYGVGFGVAKPASNLRKYFGLQYGQIGNQIADSFSYLMCANHVGGVIQTTFDIAYQFRAYNRAVRDGDADLDLIDKDFDKALTDDVISISEKTLELVSDACIFLKNTVPAWLRIPLGLGINGLALWRVWRKTA